MGLIDTGSTRCFVSGKFFECLKGNPCVKKINKINRTVQAASRDKIVVRKEATIHFKIHEFSWNFKFWVMNQLPYDVVLGFDFFKQSQMFLDVSQGKIGFKFSNEQINCVVSDIDYQKTDITLEDSSFTPDQKDRLNKLMNSFGDVLSKRVGRAKCEPYQIKIVGSPQPKQCRPYQCNPERMKALKASIEEMLDQDVIEKSHSSWSVPAFVIPKKDKNKFRFLCDFRSVNQYIELDPFPTPKMDNLFQYMREAKYFTSFDFVSAYHQVPITEQSREFTSFITPFGQFQYKVIPQGLKVGSAALHRLMHEVFSDIQYSQVLNFADDLVIFSNTAEEHIAHIKEVLTRLRTIHLTINPEKVSLAKNGVHFLGFVVKEGKLFIDPKRTECISQYPIPRTLKHVQKFLGFCSFFSKFIQNFAAISVPLNRLKRKGVKFKWTEECQKSFDTLRKALISPPVLQLPVYSSKFILNCDASENAIGAALGQMRDGVWLPVAFASRTLSNTEAGYSVFRKEFLACLWACEKFRDILADTRFILRTDCQAVVHVLNSAKRTGQMARWKLRLSEFSYDLEHCRATQNILADTLSRLFDQKESENKIEEIKTSDVTLILKEFPECFSSLPDYQRNDPELKNIISQIENKQKVQHFEIKSKILRYKKNQKCASKVVVPKVLQPVIIKFFHDTTISGHMGVKKTIARITREFTWKNMFQDVKHYVRSCELCSKSKPAQNQQYGLMFSKPSTQVFEKVHLDLFGPLLSSDGFTYILVAIDSFSKFVFMRPIRKATTEIIIRELKEHIFAQNGFPQIILSDNGSQFTSAAFKSFLFGLGIKHYTTSVARPQGNQSERVNRNLKFALKIYHSETQNKWSRNLAYLCIAFNSAPHDSHKRTPSSVFLGRELNHPLKLIWSLETENENSNETVEQRLREVVKELRLAHAKSKERYDKNRKPSPFKLNDKVLYRIFIQSSKAKNITNKLSPIWKGPFLITEIINPVNVKIQSVENPNFTKVVHVAQLKRFYERESAASEN